MVVRFAGLLCGVMMMLVCSVAANAQSGIASIYAYKGGRTASGERVSPDALSKLET